MSAQATAVRRGWVRRLSVAALAVTMAGGVAIASGLGGITAGDSRAGAEAAARALGPGARVSRTANFTIVSDSDVAWTREREAILERTYHEMERFARRVGATFRPPAEPMVCVLIHDHAAYRAFAVAQDGVRAEWVAGYYAAAPNRVVFYDDRTAPWMVDATQDLDEAAADARAQLAMVDASDAGIARMLRESEEELEAMVRAERSKIREQARVRSEAKTVHEAAHLIAFNCGLQLRTRRYPFWITEGLATSFETDSSRERFGPWTNHPPRDAEVRARMAGFEPLETFLSRTEPPRDREAALDAYAQAYAIFTYAARKEPRKVGAVLKELAESEPVEPNSPRALEVFTRAFGSVESFERRFAAWMRREFGGG